MSAPLELPRWDGSAGNARRTLTGIDRWAGSRAMSGLVREFGGSVADLAPDDRLAYLDAFAAAHWDFRAGGERNLAPVPRFPPGREAAIHLAAAQLGLASNAPPSHTRYDAVLMTGGMVRAAVVKPRHVRDLVHAGLGARSIVFLGAFRSFAGDEAAVAARLGINATGEFEAMVSGLDAAFGPLGEPTVEGDANGSAFRSWCESSWQHGGSTLRVIAARSPSASRRANTADTFRFWAERHAAGVESVLVVTAPVYVPYQAAVAVEILGVQHGLAVETVAVSTSASDLGPDTQVFAPAHKLQELRSAIHGMRSLRLALMDRPTAE